MSIQKPQQESSYNPEDLETTLPTRFDQEKKPLTVTQLQPPGQQQKQNIPSITPSPQQTSIQPLQPTQQPDGQQQVINIMRMKSKPIEPNFKPLRVQDLKKDNVLPEYFGGLSKPAISKAGDRFLCGTEVQTNESNMCNRLVFGTIDLSKDLTTQCWSYPINEHVRDLDWLDDKRVVVALNQKLGIIILGDNNNVNEIVLFPDFHTDSIRQLAVNPKNNALVISGGFDGNVFVTNIARLVDDIQKNEKKSENSVYLCRDVVGSVAWHPRDYNVASCTTDLGVLHVFDIRTDQSKPAFVYDTRKIELYTHAYMDDFTVVLGYGDGHIQIHDIRNGKGMIAFKDPNQLMIGDIIFANSSSTISYPTFTVFGSELTAWRYDQTTVEMYGHHSFSQSKEHKTAGQFVPNTSLLAVTDSYPFFFDFYSVFFFNFFYSWLL